MAALEALGARRGALEERLLTMLRLIHHTRELLLRNVELFASLEAEALARLGHWEVRAREEL